jgi:hypothetical protein
VKLLTRFEAYSKTLSESAGLFTKIGVVLVALASSKLIYKFMQFLVINYAYGHAAWVSGLRVTDWKHGVLSDGNLLSGWPYVTFYLGGFVLWGLFSIGSLFLFSYVGLRLRGRRLSDPKPKKKWQSSGKSDHAA